MTSEIGGMFERLRAETAQALGYSEDSLTLSQSTKLDRITALRLELDQQLARQLEGDSVDVHRLSAIGEQLDRLLPPDASRPDTFRVEFVSARLSDGELSDLERLIAKGTGEEPTADDPSPEPDGPFAGWREQQARELADLRTKCMEQTIALESQRTLIAQLQAQLGLSQPEPPPVELPASPPPSATVHELKRPEPEPEPKPSPFAHPVLVLSAPRDPSRANPALASGAEYT